MTDPSGSATPTGAEPDGDVALWQDTLACEHAVIWSYGLVGATDDLAAPADAALAVHRRRRATCVQAVADLGAEPVAAAAAYDVAKPQGADSARTLAGDLEGAASVAYLTLSSSTDREVRLLAAQWLRESAIAETRWTGAIPALPGFDGD